MEGYQISFKNIRIKKRGGGYRTQRVQVLASGKYKFVKNIKNTTPSKSTSKKKSKKGGSRTTTKKNKKSRRKQPKLALSSITSGGVLLFAPSAPGWSNVMDHLKQEDLKNAFGNGIKSLTGITIPVGQRPFDIPILDILNPLNVEVAPALKTFFYTKLLTKFGKKIFGNPISRIPYVKDFISFS